MLSVEKAMAYFRASPRHDEVDNIRWGAINDFSERLREDAKGFYGVAFDGSP